MSAAHQGSGRERHRTARRRLPVDLPTWRSGPTAAPSPRITTLSGATGILGPLLSGRRPRRIDGRRLQQPYWTGKYGRQARCFHPDRREPHSSTSACTTASTRSWWMTVDQTAPRAACCSVNLRRTRARQFCAAVRPASDGRRARVRYEPARARIGVDRLLGPQGAFSDPRSRRDHASMRSRARTQETRLNAPKKARLCLALFE